MQRPEYLDALGVTQYRRRELSVKAQSESEVAGTEEVSDLPTNRSIRLASDGLTETGLSKEARSAQKPDTRIYDKQEHAGFELLVWQLPGLLALDFSLGQSDQLSLKHQLTNNILKAIWPQDFRGTAVNQHIWPIPGLPGGRDSLTDWLMSMISGHVQKNPQCSIWLMGPLGIDLLFPDFDDDIDTLIGSKVRHNSFATDFLMTPTLSDMLEDPVAKAITWQLLKPLKYS